jgi:hypothetical protein
VRQSRLQALTTTGAWAAIPNRGKVIFPNLYCRAGASPAVVSHWQPERLPYNSSVILWLHIDSGKRQRRAARLLESTPAQSFAHDFHQRTDLRHKLTELLRLELLATVTERRRGIGMHFDE